MLAEAEQLSADERADLTDRLVEKGARLIPADIERARFEEARRRIARVEAGEVELVPAGRVFAQGQELLESLARARQPL